ncbi:MAG: DNA-binding domain-containing protein [Pseudomonadota bacterium]
MTPSDKIVAVLRSGKRAAWTLRELSNDTELTAPQVRDAVQSLRWSGKMDFESLTLTPSMLGALPLVAAIPASEAVVAEPVAITVAPAFVAARKTRTDPLVWARFLEDYLRPEGPSLLASYQRTHDWAAEKGLPIAGIQAFRNRVHSDKIEQPKPTIADRIDRLRSDVAEEARGRVTSRAVAGRIGLTSNDLVLTPAEEVTVGLAETVQDAMVAISRRWPGTLQRLIETARRYEARPGLFLAQAVEAGLDALEQRAG